MEDNQVIKHICGVCKDEWLSEQEYLDHVCPNTERHPTEPEHLINSTTPDFAEISTAALERGAADQEANPPVSEPVSPDPAPEQPQPEQPAEAQAPTINLG
jgi:hypothetical protein